MIRIIKANINNIDEIIALYNSCFLQTYSRFFFENLLDDLSSFWYMLSVDDNICGFICGTFVVDEVNIISVGVSREFRNRGLAKMLFYEAINESKRNGMVSMLLEVSVLNYPAISLYKSLGFNKIGYRKGYYKTEEGLIDAEVYRLFL